MLTLTDTHATRMTYSRIAGFTYLFYIAAGIFSLSLSNDLPVTDLLGLLLNLSALILGVTLYMLTREQGPAIALLALTCRIMDAILDQSPIFFAVGSLLFCWLLLRGRMIPASLAWLGAIASALLVIILPLQLAGALTSASWSDSITWLVWLPMLIFEVVFSFWLFLKGVHTEN